MMYINAISNKLQKTFLGQRMDTYTLLDNLKKEGQPFQLLAISNI